MRSRILGYCFLFFFAFGTYAESLFSNPSEWRYSSITVASVSNSGYLLESHLDYYFPGTLGVRVQAIRLATLQLPRSSPSLGVLAWPGFALGALSSGAYFQLNNMGSGSGIGYPLILGYVSLLGAINDFVFHPQVFAILPGNLKVGVGYDIDWFPTDYWLSTINAYNEISFDEGIARPADYKSGGFFVLVRFSLSSEWNDRDMSKILQPNQDVAIGVGYKF